MCASPSIQKSNSKKRESRIIPTNDETERKRRRSYVAEQTSQNSSESIPIMSDREEVRKYIEMCQKLFNENKINIHNAWDIKIADYLKWYVSNNLESSEAMFVVTNTLEVCVKVYGCKIMYLEKEIVKLASTSHTQIVENQASTTVKHNNETIISKTKKKKRSLITSHLVKDRNALLEEIPKLASTRFTGNFDINANNFDNMYSNRIPMDHAANKFNLLNNEDSVFISYDTKHPILQEKLTLVNIPSLKDFVICFAFKNFDMDETDDHQESFVDIINNNNQPKVPSTLVSEIVYDDDGIPVPELDGSQHDIFANDTNIVEEEVEAIGQASKRRVEMITSVQINNSRVTSCSNSFVDTVWVGPSYWRNKSPQSSVPKYSEKPRQKVLPRKRKKKSISPIIEQVNFEITFNINRYRQCNAEFKKISYNGEKCTFSTKYLLDLENFNLLDITSEKELEDSPYNYNANDSQTQLDAVNKSIPGNIVIYDDVNEDVALHDCSETRNSVVAVSDTATQLYVPYALREKKINLKLLKSSILKCLIKKTHTENNVDTEKQFKASVLFSAVYKRLHSIFSMKKRNEFSIPLAFFSLLQVTNEYNLKLTQFEDLSDIKIKKH